MATEMQPVFNGFPSHSSQGIQDAKDRQPAVQGSDPSRNFESMLGRAEARHMSPKHEAPTLRSGERAGLHERQALRPASDSSSQRPERSTVAQADDQPSNRCECAADNTQHSSDTSEDKSATQESKKKDPGQEAVSQDMLLAAMMVPGPQAAPVEQQPHAESESDNDSDTAVNAAASVSTGGAPEGSAPVTPLVAATPEDGLATQGVPAGQPAPKTDGGKEAAQAKDRTGNETAQMESTALLSDATPIPSPEGRTAERSDSAAGVRTEADRLNSAMAAMTSSKTQPQIAEQGSMDRADRSAILDALVQGSSLSEGQAASSSGRFLEPDGQSLSDSSGGTDRSLPNQVPSVEQNARPAFMDRINEVNQSAPSVGDSSFGRSESGQTTAVLRASESERVGDLRGMAPVSQSVTLDLDPLDMGPLRVRVMMSDQTVHAHIRTEHGELGQGLLQQGQSLESSLRTSGLEMGMLRVTVDQQQGRGDNAWMFQQQQQQQSRPPSPNLSQSVAREDERGVRGERGAGSNDRVSFFA